MEQNLSMGALIRKLAVERLIQTHPAAAFEIYTARHERLVLRFKLSRTAAGGTL